MGDGDTNCDGCVRNNSKKIGKSVEQLEFGRWIETVQTSAF